MIRLSRLNGKDFVVNCELIKFVEETPDTVITLTTGEKLMVREKSDEVIRATMEYRKRLYQDPPSTSEAAVKSAKGPNAGPNVGPNAGKEK